jgi:predicted metal-dependent hydrolase
METISLKNKKICYKIIKKPIKHLYLRIKDNHIEISCNHYVTKSYIEKIILKNQDYILNKLNNKHYYLFGKKYEKTDIDLKELYKKELLKVIFEIINKYSEIMHLKPNKVSFRYNKTRWGSCSFKNNITLNYYLAKLPIELIEYVVVHELAHIKYKNHSKDFWKFVEKFMSDYKIRVKKLKEFERIV